MHLFAFVTAPAPATSFELDTVLFDLRFAALGCLLVFGLHDLTFSVPKKDTKRGLQHKTRHISHKSVTDFPKLGADFSRSAGQMFARMNQSLCA